MAKIVEVCVVVAIFYLPVHASPTNWLYDAPRALFGLASSASASASASATPISYIADLRRRDEKSEKLRNDKGLSEQVELLDRNTDQDESNGGGEGDTEGNNEASPSFLEKKVAKILAKLRLIAQIKNAYHYKPEVHEHESNITFTSEETTSTRPKTNSTVTIEIEKENLKEDKNIIPRITTIKLQSENIKPAAAYGVPKEPIKFPEEKEVESGPTRIELDINQINNKLEDLNPPKKQNLTDREPGRFGTLGVFFAELLGSIVGLTYGAFAQIASGGQSPVTVSTSEGL